MKYFSTFRISFQELFIYNITIKMNYSPFIKLWYSVYEWINEYLLINYWEICLNGAWIFSFSYWWNVVAISFKTVFSFNLCPMHWQFFFITPSTFSANPLFIGLHRKNLLLKEYRAYLFSAVQNPHFYSLMTYTFFMSTFVSVYATDAM